jgi:TRAP-type C4-dicarboxylate transport system permease small subunit
MSAPGSGTAAARTPPRAGHQPGTTLLPAVAGEPAPLRLLGALVDWTIIGMGATMIGLVFVNVLTHLFGRDIAWTTELCELLMVWVTFLGGAAAARRGAHMSITEFLDKLPESRRRAADAAIQLFTICILGLLAIYGWKIAQSGWSNELTVLGWPMATQNLALPVASVLTMLFAAWDLVQIGLGKSRSERYGD